MAVNVPQYDTDNFSFGPGILYVAALTQSGAAGITTMTQTLVTAGDVGAVRSGAQFQVTRTRLEVNQGSPISLVKQYVTAEDAQLTVNGIEWDLEKLQLALGAGEVATSAALVTMGFGGDLDITDVAVKFTHVMPKGHTLSLRLWKAQGTGEMTVTFGDELHEFPYSFKSLLVPTQSNGNVRGWDDEVLSAKESLFQIVIEKAS